MKTLGRIFRWFFLINLLMVGAAKALQRVLPDNRDATGDEADVTAIFEESTFGSTAQSLRRIGAVTAYGKSTIDLSDSVLSATGAEVNVYTVYGETEIIVPKGWNVISDHGVLAGALERRGGDVPDVPRGTIHLGGMTVFGATIVSRAN